MKTARRLLDTARYRWLRMDRLVRAMIVNWIGGMGVGLICAALLLAYDFAGVRTLLLRSDMFITGTLMLFAAFAFTFGGIVCAAAVMRFGSEDDDEPRGGRRSRVSREPRPVLAMAPARRFH